VIAEEILLRLGDWALVSAVPALALFVFFYGIRSNWRVHRIGRALFWMTVSLLVVCGLFVLTLSFGDWPLKPYVRVGAYGFVSFTIWRMFWELRLIQKQGGDGDGPGQTMTPHQGEKK
jgi:hypothetical protein